MDSGTTYCFWRHTSGDVYAIRQQNGRVTGCVGPLSEAYQDRENLPDHHWDDFTEDAAWAEEHEAEFRLYEGC